MALSVEKITFAYTRQGRPILQQFSARFEKDAITVLTGASGCGKSTLLYVMAGIYPGDAGFLREGTVTVDGQDPAQLPPPEK
ncbi:MAG: ATP-binding cassette domain-containing protein, partial [Acutalibacteraceae bacterium]